MSASHKKIRIRVQRLRSAKGFTQAGLAKKANVTQAFISQLEAGLKENPGIVPLLRIAKALGVSVERLLE